MRVSVNAAERCDLKSTMTAQASGYIVCVRGGWCTMIGTRCAVLVIELCRPHIDATVLARLRIRDLGHASPQSLRSWRGVEKEEMYKTNSRNMQSRVGPPRRAMSARDRAIAAKITKRAAKTKQRFADEMAAYNTKIGVSTLIPALSPPAKKECQPTTNFVQPRTGKKRARAKLSKLSWRAS